MSPRKIQAWDRFPIFGEAVGWTNHPEPDAMSYFGKYPFQTKKGVVVEQTLRNALITFEQ
jgi:hypothetical protein